MIKHLMGSRVAVRLTPAAEQTESGILIPEKHREVPREGTVMFVGPLVEELTVGDVVLFGKYSGTPVELDGEELIIIDEADIFCAIDEVV